MPLAVGGVFIVIFIGLIVAYLLASRPAAGIHGQPVASIRCEAGEQLAVHYHSHLDVIYKGQPVSVPGQVGIPSGSNCVYWLHTHDNTGVIHVEAPKESSSRQFTLSDFFAVWNQPLSQSQVATLKLGPEDQMRVWVNGEAYSGDPSKIVLKSHEQIVIAIGPPFPDQPPNFVWDPQL